jgi:hypothetical protein
MSYIHQEIEKQLVLKNFLIKFQIIEKLKQNNL